ncbi:hypothetical protein [Methanobrevibacter curvatus]|nr:hypothetical protein [Methanobrevibacter curvatus]
MSEIEELTEKKYKSRIRKFKKAIKNDEEKSKFFIELAASVEIFLPTKNPEEEADGINFITTPDGKVTFAEYYYEKEGEAHQIEITGKDLDLLLELFDGFKLQLDDVLE